MNILIVTAHDDPKSFVAALHNSSLGVLERAGHKVEITELYAQAFNPIASVVDFKTSSVSHANYMFEQQRTMNTGGGFSPDIKGEMDKITNAELIIFHFPLWWGGMPAVLKGWFDRVFAMGFAWSAENRYSEGLLRGRKALVTVTTGDPMSYYSLEGMHKASVEQHLYGLLHGTLAFCGLDVHKPCIISNTTAASREELEAGITHYREFLSSIDTNRTYIYKQS